MNEEYKSIDELIELLNRLKEQGSGFLSYPKALLLVATEVKRLQEIVEQKKAI